MASNDVLLNIKIDPQSLAKAKGDLNKSLDISLGGGGGAGVKPAQTGHAGGSSWYEGVGGNRQNMRTLKQAVGGLGFGWGSISGAAGMGLMLRYGAQMTANMIGADQQYQGSMINLRNQRNFGTLTQSELQLQSKDISTQRLTSMYSQIPIIGQFMANEQVNGFNAAFGRGEEALKKKISAEQSVTAGAMNLLEGMKKLFPGQKITQEDYKAVVNKANAEYKTFQKDYAAINKIVTDPNSGLNLVTKGESNDIAMLTTAIRALNIVIDKWLGSLKESAIGKFIFGG